MSDNSDNVSEDHDKGLDKCDDICRDFLRNVCKRGKRCRYRHPETSDTQVVGRHHEYTFCHDFQNSGCRRPNCKFMHCTRDEEDYYKQTGQLPVRLQQAAALGIGVVPKEQPLLKGEVPVCRDYLKGECKRAGRCKFRHMTTTQFDLESTRKDRHTCTTLVSNNNLDRFDTYNPDDFDRFEYDHSVKRRRLDTEFDILMDGYSALRSSTDSRLLEEENNLLRRKVEELKKQVSDLAATNEVLLEQNARYRSSKVSVVTTAPPIVTVSQVGTPTITPAPIVARTAMAAMPAQGMAPLNPLSTTMTQPLTVMSTSDMIMTHQVMQPRLAVDLGRQATIPTGAATINPPAVSLTQQAIVPVSIAMDTVLTPQAIMATVSLPTPSVTLTQTSSLQTRNIMSGHGPSAPMVSYPIVSHCVAQIAANSLG